VIAACDAIHTQVKDFGYPIKTLNLSLPPLTDLAAVVGLLASELGDIQFDASFQLVAAHETAIWKLLRERARGRKKVDLVTRLELNSYYEGVDVVLSNSTALQGAQFHALSIIVERNDDQRRDLQKKERVD
jgi:hypothetical protein